MNIHIVKSPEYDIEGCNDVVDLLTNFDGPINYILPDFEFDPDKFPFLLKYYPHFKFNNPTVIKKKTLDYNKAIPLSFKELFSLCDCYRSAHNVPNEDFVILLTLRRNALNWFSHTKDRNAFVHTDDWENFTEANPKYPIAYQVLENFVQSIMDLDMSPHLNLYVHDEPIGCMNDFCGNKEQIILKLRTADICKSCLDRIYEQKINDNILNQVLQTFEGIRDELLFKQKYKRLAEPVSIMINQRNKISLPDLNNLEIRLNPLFKTVYLFYLKHPEGVKLKELCDHKNELMEIYGRLSLADDKSIIAEKIDDLINPISNSFSQKKSKINKIITDLLGEPLAKTYRIEGKPAEPFKINIPEGLIHIMAN